MSQPLQIAVIGPTGRLGQAITRAVIEAEDCELCGAVVRAMTEADGRDVGELIGGAAIGIGAQVSLELASADADVVIDASMPGMTVAAAERLAVMGKPALVTGVTGFNASQEAQLAAAADKLPILKAGNFSLGVALVEALVRQAASLPAADWDIEIEETHHRRKADAPSGTALLLGRAAAEGRGVKLESASVWSREGTTGPRRTGDIGFAVTRGGSIVGEHAVRFLSDMEEVSISHRAFDRALFAKGALEAARWMSAGRAPGLYSMQDVIGS